MVHVALRKIRLIAQPLGRTKEGRRQARLRPAGFDLINPKHLLNGYKLKAVSI